MSVPVVNLRIEKGTTFEATFNVTNSDGSVFELNNYTATAKVKKFPAASSSTSFSTTITSSTGEIKISMASTITSELNSGRSYYDVIITKSTGAITKAFEGSVMVVDTLSA
tara:strand:+ start:135 stop:467 length:333 start_codon:yes stop_codon:yes gene_type:complete